MFEIKEFSKEVIDEIQSYVYRLVDPRDGITFYVGKGVGNRVFNHLNAAKKKVVTLKNEDEQSLKLKVIREIIDTGLEVIHIIQRYGLNDDEARIIESVLIDVYSLGMLTNEVKGILSDKGPINAITLQKNLSIVEYYENEIDFKYIIIKIKDHWLAHNNYDRYETTRKAWKINVNNTKGYDYVLSVSNGIVKEVYKVHDWYELEENRYGFNGERAIETIKDKFINKKIPEAYRKKGMASPFLYCNKK